ncbi:MAG: VWA domain-containing protein [Terracidiphilus sp.]
MSRASRLFKMALCLSLAAPLWAQNTAPADTEAPAATLKLNVRTVLVDVVVTDKDNRAVAGLKKEDFQVLEDGKPQSVSFFEPNFAADVNAASAAPTPHLPPNFFTNVPLVAPNNSVNLLLMDALNTQIADQSAVHKQMIKYLGSIPPGIRIGVFLLSDRLRIIQGFTQDSAILRASIKRFAANPSTAALLPTAASTAALQVPVNIELQKAVESGSTQLADMAAHLEQFEDQQSFFETNERTIMTLDSLQQIARYLSGVPGRKNLIWFVGAIPQCLAAMTSESELTVSGCPYEEKYAKTMDMLADARVSVYPIDASGLPSDTLYDADSPPASGDLGLAGSTVTPPNTPIQPALSAFQQVNAAQSNALQSDFQKRALAHLQMDQLAKVTGGSAAYERNTFEDAIAKAVDNGSRYYTLAYTPSNHREVGKERKIEIRSASGSYRLSYRRSYFEDSPKDRNVTQLAAANDPLRPLMDRGMPNFSELRYRLKVAPANPQPTPDATRAGDNTALNTPTERYTVNFWLSTDGLTLNPGPDGVRRGTVEVALVAYSQDGKPLNWQARSVGLAIRPEQNAIAQASGIPLHFDIDAPPGDVYLRTGVCDSQSSKAGTLEIPLRAVMVAER